MPTSASPRNSRRSLCGAPALRWVSAWASSAGSRNTCPAMRASASVDRTGPGQHLRGLEPAHDVEVAHQRPADLVLHVDLPAGADALDLDVLGLHVLRVVHVEAAEEQVLDPARLRIGDAGLVG